MATDPNCRLRIPWTSEDRARHQAIRDQFQTEPSLSELLESGEITQEGHDLARSSYNDRAPGSKIEDAAFRRLISALKSERERLGISLPEIAKNTGIELAMLSRLENGPSGDPTVSTVSRYAMALGKAITWGLENGSSYNQEDAERTDS
jgi:Helix-turn-helix